MRSPLLFASLLLLTAMNTAPAVEIIGHRGASYDAPENTLASFNLGWKQGADAGELDIYLTKDGEVVVIHDSSTKRTAGLDRPVGEQTLAELRTLDAGSWKGSQWAREKLPTLAEAIATIPDGKRLFIEIKCGLEVLPALEKVIGDCSKKPEQLVLIGFSLPTMTAAKKRFPRLTAFWIVGYDAKKQPDKLIQQAKEAHLDGLDLQGTFLIDAAFVAQTKAAGLQLCTWTVDDPALAGRLIQAGVDGITTNRPGWLRQQLASRAK